MTSTTIHVQQVGGTCFSLKCLYSIAHAEEKGARQLFAKEALMTAAADTVTAMSSIRNKDFSKIGPKLDWNGDEDLKNLWGRYYRCPDAEFIQRAQAAHMQQDPFNFRLMYQKGVCWFS